MRAEWAARRVWSGIWRGIRNDGPADQHLGSHRPRRPRLLGRRLHPDHLPGPRAHRGPGLAARALRDPVPGARHLLPLRARLAEQHPEGPGHPAPAGASSHASCRRCTRPTRRGPGSSWPGSPSEHARIALVAERKLGVPALPVRTCDLYGSGQEYFDVLLADLASAKRFIHMNYFIWGKDELTARITAGAPGSHRGGRRGADPQRPRRLHGVLEGRARRAAQGGGAGRVRHQPARPRELPQPPQDHRRRRGDRAQRRVQHRPGVHRRRQEVPGVARHGHPDDRARASRTWRSCSTCAGTRCSARTCSSPGTTRTPRCLPARSWCRRSTRATTTRGTR